MNVVLLPATDTAEQVAAHLRAWSAARLLTRFCVWRPSDQPSSRVCLLLDGEERTVPLAEALGDARASETHFIACMPAGADEAIEESFGAEVEAFLERAARVVAFDQRVQRTCTMAVIPSELPHPLPASLFRARWHALLVAPEDRVGPLQPNRLADEGDDEDRFVRHAAHAVATLAGLWATSAANRADATGVLRAEPTGTLAVGVRVVRCRSRAVDLGHVADHVAEAVFAEADGWPSPGRESFERAPDPQSVVEGLARAFLHKHRRTLGPREFEELRGERPTRFPLLEALRALVAHIRAWIRRRPLELLDEAVGAAHDAAAKRIEQLGGGSGIRVLRWDELTDTDRRRGLGWLSARIERDEELPVADGAVSATWRDLRHLTIGIVDGSDLPEGIDSPALRHGRRRVVVCNPRYIAYDPRAGDEPATTTGNAPLLALIRRGVEKAIGDLIELIRSLEEQLDALRASELAEEPDTERSRLARLLRRIGFGTLLALAASAAGWWTFPPGRALPLTLLAGLLWITWTLTSVYWLLGRSLLETDAARARQLKLLNLVLQLAQRRGELRRLERRRDELRDWTLILQELVHYPWLGEPLDALDLGGAIELNTLPAAFSVAVAQPDATALRRVGEEARAHAFRAGWLAEIYRVVDELALEEYAAVAGMRRELLLDASADASLDPEPQRRMLLDTMLRGDGRGLRESPLTADLTEVINGTSLDVLAPEVAPANAGVRPPAPTTTWIVPPHDIDAAAAAFARRVVPVGVGDAVGLLLDAQTILTAADAVRGPRAARIARALGAQVRIGAASGLALLELAEPVGRDLGEDPSATTDWRSGTPIVAPAAAVGDEQPEARWGFMLKTVGGVMVVCDGGPPPSGTPLFDLDGRLVAVHGRGGRAHPVPDLAALRRESAEPPEQLVASAGDDAGERRRAEAGEPASAFLRGLADGAHPLNPDYWAAPTRANAIELSFPASLALEGEAGRIAPLCGGAAFMRPLRVMVHRVELTRAGSLEAFHVPATTAEQRS